MINYKMEQQSGGDSKDKGDEKADDKKNEKPEGGDGRI